MTAECQKVEAYLNKASEWTDELERHSSSCDSCRPVIIAHRSLGETLASIEVPKVRTGFETRLRYRIQSSAPLSSRSRWIMLIYGLLSLIVTLGLISRFDLEQVGMCVYVGAGVMILSVLAALFAVLAGRPGLALTRFGLTRNLSSIP